MIRPIMYGKTGYDDTFTFHAASLPDATTAEMRGVGYSYEFTGFRNVTAYASALPTDDGDYLDTALMFDSPGRDTFSVWPGHAIMTNAVDPDPGSYALEAFGFSWRNVTGSFSRALRPAAEQDTANMYFGTPAAGTMRGAYGATWTSSRTGGRF